MLSEIELTDNELPYDLTILQEYLTIINHHKLL